MPTTQKKYITLDRFLAQRQQGHPDASGELTRVLCQIGMVAKIISGYMRRAPIEGLLGYTGEVNIQGEDVKKMDKLSNDAFVDAFEYVDIVGAIVSEEMEQPVIVSSDFGSEKYMVLVDPVDGSSNLDVDCTVGSIFSIRSYRGSLEKSLLQEGATQVAAGYIMYGSSVLLVYSAGDGVHSFVLDEQIGEFVLDHDNIRMPDEGKIISANFANYGKWAQPARAFFDAIRGEDQNSYSLRYSGALVADMHQILHRGGIYAYPEEAQKPQGKLRLLYECAPLAMIAEQAGGAGTTGKMRINDIRPEVIHQRVPFAVGSRQEIQKYEAAYGRHD
jgi:fructose-1,6-bisphosphatase I